MASKIHHSRGLFCGAADGINPCALTTLIFFVSYLLMIGFSRPLILKVGIVFMTVYFWVYFSIGLGLLEIIRRIAALKFAQTLLYKGMGVLLFGLFVLSIWDAWLCYKGKASKSILQLSDLQKLRIHAIIRERIKDKNLVLASACIAVLISLAEFTCTGQIYLPTLTYAIKSKTTLPESLGLLWVYNAGFVLPILLVFAAVYRGMSERIIASVFRQNSGNIKLVMGIVFLGFSALLFWF